MLKTRLVVGSLLVLWGLAVLFVDSIFAPWYPILFAFAIVVTFALAYELRQLLPEAIRPKRPLLFLAMLLIVLANWAGPLGLQGGTLGWICGALAAGLVLVFLGEAWSYREPGAVTQRLGLTFWILGYIGLFGSFLIQLRWFQADDSLHSSTIALLLAIFVPKCCDIGAYTLGRLFGKHPMSPLLSPKKTVEGAIGGLLTSALASLAITHGVSGWLAAYLTQPLAFPLCLRELAGLPGWVWSLAFGAVIGLVGMWGDLMESLVKRDFRQKDAAATLPGFGGFLDVFDSILFSAPASFALLHFLAHLGQSAR
jgi:phosphatidate cytidylyltransferase